MADSKNPRWSDSDPDGKRKANAGDLFWVDQDSTIRVVSRCLSCNKGFLILWTSKATKKLKCKDCEHKAPQE